MKNEDLKWIKKHYGEVMMKVCSLHFSSILVTPKLLTNILKENFHISKSLISDILIQKKEEDFIKFVYSKTNINTFELKKTNKNPYELMSQAGYNLYKCESQNEINEFKKYFNDSEQLCTFKDDRLKRCDVFFGVKKNLKKIKRSQNPKREDEYGTSVISIQFNKGEFNNVSIKNRYNHTVSNPDVTFDNNLENIIPGLTYGFEKYYGYQIKNLKTNDSFELINYVQGPDNKFYKFNLELNGMYFCNDNVLIKDNKITKYPKEQYILMEKFLLDLKSKTIKDLSGYDLTIESELSSIEQIKIIKKIEKEIIIKEYNKKEETKLVLNENNEILEINMPNINEIKDEFLIGNRKLRKINIPKVNSIGDGFLQNNKSLKTLTLPQTKKIGNNFLFHNVIAQNLDLPYVEEIGDLFLARNEKMVDLTIPKVIKIGHRCCYSNETITKLEAPSLNEVDDYFLFSNKHLNIITLPKIEEIGNGFCYKNKTIEEINCPLLTKVGMMSLYQNIALKKIYTPNLTKIGNGFLCNYNNLNQEKNTIIKKLNDQSKKM